MAAFGFVLFVLIFNENHTVDRGSQSSYDAPVVTTQLFSNEKACVHAREVILRRAGRTARQMDVFCVPK